MNHIHNIYQLLPIVFLTFLLPLVSLSQTQPSGTRDVYVDENGIMRWGDTKKEVYGFGVNYTVPFAHGHRTAERMGVDHEKAIDNDVYHFARLGFDLYRVHVWDTEISDTVGNLLENEHLKLFDYLLKQLSDRGINYVVTPIAFWGNGWPEPDEETPGFSAKYGKGACLTNPEAIKAQENYLYQFLNHVNAYTGIAYKNDPNLIAFEISNEPHHRGTPEEVTEFIQKMVDSMRKTGCRKPIFYNISHSVHLAEAYFDADIQGGTFQWYPTGLGFQKELQGNLLPNVNDYYIPFDDVIKQNNGAKLVYEFDAADVGRSYIYPAMARSFRTAGIQIATHFAYDPTYMAYANTEYNTHYMNLVYAPQKALALKIAGEVFRRVPLGKSFGGYPANKSFEPFRVSYEEDLAEMNTDTRFFYTNSTNSSPRNLKQLEQVAGAGNSPVVQYEGTGAYFLDKIEKGVWRLEVLPDAIWVNNLFGRNSPKKTVAVINWREWPMQIDLQDLGEGFDIKAINEGKSHAATANGKSFTIAPGTYLLTRKGTSTRLTGAEEWKNITLNEYFAPQSTVTKTYVLHDPIREVSAGNEVKVNATIVSVEPPQEVKLMYYAGWRPQSVDLKRVKGYEYEATIPGDAVQPGYLRYYLVVKDDKGNITHPSGWQGTPRDWDFYDNKAYEVKVLEKGEPVYLFDAFNDSDYLARRWVEGSGMKPLPEPGKGEYLVNVEELFQEDPENEKAEKIYDYSMKYYIRNKISGRWNDFLSKEKIVFRGRSLNDKPCQLQIAFVMKDGASYGATVEIQPEKGDYELPVEDLNRVKTVTLPRPYPTFLPYYFKNTSPEPFALENAESLQFSIGPGMPEGELKEKHGVAIESVRVE